jgi:hypothetical protein
MANLHKDFKEFLQLLTAHRVKFLIVGAHALAAHGQPRYTGDLDVFVESSEKNAKRVVKALAEFGFGSVGLVLRDFTTRGRVTQLGFPPVRIDILTSISGVSFATAWEGRKRGTLGGVAVSYLGKREFIRNKTRAGRPKDLADLALLREQE